MSTAHGRSGEAPVLPSMDDLGKGDEAPTAGGPKCSKEKNRQVGCHCTKVCTATVTAHTPHEACLAAFTWPATEQALSSPVAVYTRVKTRHTAGRDSNCRVLQAQRRFRERQKTLIGDLRENVRLLHSEVDSQSKQIFVLQVRLLHGSQLGLLV